MKEISGRILSTKTRSFALDVYEAIVESAFGHINYHVIEILSS